MGKLRKKEEKCLIFFIGIKEKSQNSSLSNVRFFSNVNKMAILRDNLLNGLSQKIQSCIARVYLSGSSSQLSINKKEDSSLVTNIDLEISKIIKSELHPAGCQKSTFYCEEDHTSLSFPATILDPIDGTSGLVNKTFESSVSLAIFTNPRIIDGEGWIYNPFNGFSLSTSDLFVKGMPMSFPVEIHGLVSRSEWKRGVYKNLNLRDICLFPLGSIAYKLGLLASGACHFVITANSKNIWDIAAGTAICRQREILLFDRNGQEIEFLDKPLYKGPMFWCREEVKEKVLPIVNELVQK